jgi:hypothetical protein
MLGICLQSEWVKEWGAITFFAALGIVVFLALGFTLFAHPLFAFDTGNIEWVRAWLWMTVLDYYGACIPFCAIIIANETSLQTGFLWSAACLLLGSPFCCLWLVLRLHNYERLQYP